MSRKDKNKRLDDQNNEIFDKRTSKKSQNKSNKKFEKKSTDKSESKSEIRAREVAFESGDGLDVERRVDKPEKKPKREWNLPSFDYTKKMRRAGEKRGTTVLFVSGKHGVRVLGALSKVCSVKNVVVSADGAQFEVESKHREQIIALLNNLCYDYKIIKVKGAVPLVFNAMSRLGFALGAIVIAAAIGIFSQFVTRVSVSATDTSSVIDGALNAKIISILNEHGVSEGSWLPKLDFGGLENSLLALDGVSYASVRRHGTHVSVEIKREQPPAEIVEISGSKVTSKKVAVVTRVVVEGGTAVVDYGDVVRAGDTLIDGYVVFGEEKLEVEAKGAVYGKVFYKKSVFFADIEKTVHRGAVKRVTKLSMFGKTPETPESPFEKSELKTTVSDLGFLLPFKIYTYEFCEITESESKNTMTDEEMSARVYSEIVAEFKEPSKVLGKYCDISAADGGKRVTVTVEAEERIS